MKFSLKEKPCSLNNDGLVNNMKKKTIKYFISLNYAFYR